MENNKRSIVILILGLLAAVCPFSIDMYLPGFPAIARDLHTTVDQVAYSLSSFFIGVCLGQLICGPLLDRFGRKTPLMIGLGLYILASIGCSLSPSVEALIGFRFLQALGACVGMVAPNAMVRDLFPAEENAKVMSLLVLILGVSPILAPTVGSYLIATSGWGIVFTVLAIVAALLLVAVMRWLPESREADAGVSLKLTAMLQGYGQVVKESQFATYAGAGALASAGLFAYLAGSPFIFMKLYGVSEQQYGIIFAMIAAGLIGSSQLNNLLLRTYTSSQLLTAVIAIQFLIGLLLLIGTVSGFLGLYSTIGLLFLFLSCQGFTFPNSAALAMAPFTQRAGSASALLGALQMVCGSIASALVGLFFNGTAVPMTAIMLICCTLGLSALLLGHRRMAYQAKREVAAQQSLEILEKF
ncbi:Bcr/CflA family efflux MFS transporter [Spirosoma sp. HMF4905]|uniref:Bcr/CflA family efflux MFS transporter n=1 Tax=Spirosoma arboris TaxID=2682092 RepID=A0A7K1SN01_9BACT|nr:multidrug effflux MFS transporter [Spirosoma arboris]MVM35053.1 Bcr/CflA family efflux MFS transporter [Spirosoma arboris]